MNQLFLTALLASTIVGTSSIAAEPAKLTPHQLAELLGVEGDRVLIDESDQHPKLVGKVVWLAFYKVTGEQSFNLIITLFPNDQIKTDFIERIGANQQVGFQKIIKEDGDVIYHALLDLGSDGASYITTLINHENDWDMTLALSHEPGVDESKLPIVIDKDGIELIGKIESALRKPMAQQGAGEQSSTSGETK